jgi:transposase
MAQIEDSVARYMHQLDSADRQEPSLARTTKTTRLTEKIGMLATPDQQISLTDPDARSMATSGRGSGVVDYNVQVAVDTEHHVIVTHEVTNVGTDRSQLAHITKEAKATLEVTNLDVVADRGYFSGHIRKWAVHRHLAEVATRSTLLPGRFYDQDPKPTLHLTAANSDGTLNQPSAFAWFVSALSRRNTVGQS